MDRFSRKEKELNEVIDQQKEQLSRYEKKLRDIIQAYKGVVKEKEALEKSFSALTEVKPLDEQKVSKDNHEPNQSTEQQVESTDVSTEESAEKNTIQTNDEVEHLKAKVATLSASLSTISTEKSRIEANFQRDRKKLMQDKEDLEKSLAAACSQADLTTQSLKQQLSEVKTQLSLEKSERGKELAKNQVTVREIQKTLSEEKQKRESLELEINAKAGRLAQAAQTSIQLETAERRLKDLSNELEATKMKLRTAEQKLEQPSPLLIQLQDEMADLKAQHRLAILQEQRNAAEAEETARQLAASHEKRVDELEASLALLSQTVGTYDRLRQQDLAQVAKLKEQLMILQAESNRTSNSEEEEYDLEKLVDKMRSLKCRLADLSERSKQPVDVAALLEQHGLSSGPSTTDHETCNAELQQLKQQIEWYQRQQVDKNQPSEKLATEEEIQKLRVQVQFLKTELEHTEKQCKESVAAVQDSWMAERSSWKEEMVQSERSFRVRIGDLEQQLQKQRERSLTLLQEKDDELSCLKEALQMKNAAPISIPAPAASSSAESALEDWPEGLASLASMTLGASASGGQILHYHEELARKELEIQSLRRSKNQLEATLRDLQMAMAAIEHKGAEERHRLREEIGRLERNRSREGANLEYLKNVLLEFFLRSDPASQSHMFNAIAAILHFSPREIQRVRQQHPKWKASIGLAPASSSPHSPL